jgi:hypothetical protein
VCVVRMWSVLSCIVVSPLNASVACALRYAATPPCTKSDVPAAGRPAARIGADEKQGRRRAEKRCRSVRKRRRDMLAKTQS